MIIKILKGEYLFSPQGTHVCDEKGFATIAEVDTECNIDEEHYQRVRDVVVADREFRGLDSEGNVIPEIINVSEEEEIPEDTVLLEDNN
jgi:hypothetical protein